MIFMLTATNNLSNNYLIQEDHNSKDKEELYISILDSYISPWRKYIRKNLNAIGIDLSFDETLSEESKENILNYFREKYQINVKSVSLDEVLEEVDKGILTTFDTFYVKINNVEFIDSSNVVSEGQYFYSPVASAAYKTYLSKKNNTWRMDERVLLWIS